MNDTKNGQPDDLDLALPWYATGRLSAEERARVEAALNTDEDLRRRLALVRDEAAETIGLNESLKAPTAAALDRLMAKIDLHEAQNPRRTQPFAKVVGWAASALDALSPRALAWSAIAAAVVICLQAALLTSLLVSKHEGATYKTASADTKFAESGTRALISFVGTISVQEMTAFLNDRHAILLDGPKPGGFYRIKIADQKLSREALNAKLAEFRAQANIVRIILPEPAKR